MTLLRNRLWISLLFASSCCGLGRAQQQRLLPVKQADLAGLRSRIDPSILPDGAQDLRINRQQSFYLAPAASRKPLTLLSVSFRVAHGAAMSLRCGVVLLRRDEPSVFFNPVPDDTPIVCEDIAAVRLRRHGAASPDFLVTGDFTVGARAWSKQFAITWDQLSGKYSLEGPDL